MGLVLVFNSLPDRLGANLQIFFIFLNVYRLNLIKNIHGEICYGFSFEGGVCIQKKLKV